MQGTNEMLHEKPFLFQEHRAEKHGKNRDHEDDQCFGFTLLVLVEFRFVLLDGDTLFLYFFFHHAAYRHMEPWPLHVVGELCSEGIEQRENEIHDVADKEDLNRVHVFLAMTPDELEG
jgi:hypothetical protein